MAEQEIVDKLHQGWMLHGDIGAQAPFGFIDPDARGFSSFPTVPADVVRTLSDRGLLSPSPLPGRTIKYTRA